MENTWLCKKCDEDIEEQFNVCWSCGYDKNGILKANDLNHTDKDANCILCNEPIHLMSNRTVLLFTGGFAGRLKDGYETCSKCYKEIERKGGVHNFWSGIRKLTLEDLNSHGILSYKQKQHKASMEKKQEEEEYKKWEKEEENKNREIEQKINKKYSKKDADRILNGRIWIDMTKEMLIDSWGEPDDEKENVSRDMIKLKWYYGARRTRQDTTVYKYEVKLENDVVEGWNELE